MRSFIIITLSVILLAGCTKENSVNNATTGNNTTGTGGSLAKFTILNDYLYAIDGVNRGYLHIFNISNTANIAFVNKVHVGMNIETIFPYNDKLFIASNSGMYIFSVSNPSNPTMETFVQHFTGCDPVVVSGNYAYLTIRGGTQCNNNLNQLQVYNVSNMAYPQMISSVNLTNPYGLGIKDSILYVCDNGVGMRLYNINNPYNLKALGIETGESFVDVIPMDSTMVCMLTNGVAFYDISNPAQISKLSVVK